MPRCHAIALALACIIVAIAGCSKTVNVPPPPKDVDTLRSASEELTIDIFVDASASMRGYVALGSPTKYAQALQLLESAALTSWPRGELTFFEFGAALHPLYGRAHLRACLPDFYDNPEFSGKTHIESVIDTADVRHLTVIVTDLFQNDADVNLLTEKVKDKFIARGLSVGIIGIKSEFSGTVFDVGMRGDRFRFVGNRPFYVLAFGNHADIAQYFRKLEMGDLAKQMDAQFLILSRQLVHPIGSFERSRIESTSKIVEVRSLMSGAAQDERVKQFRVRHDSETAAVVASLQCCSLPYTVPLENKEFKAEFEARQFRAESLAVTPEAKKAFSIPQIGYRDSLLEITAALAPQKLPGNGVYCFEVTVRPSPESYVMPGWISSWNMDTGRIDKWRQDPATFEGETTLNLQRFIDAIWDATIETAGPVVARLHYYVEKR